MNSGDLKLVFCPSGDMTADILTKGHVEKVSANSETRQE